jgi:hypothetical protein
MSDNSSRTGRQQQCSYDELKFTIVYCFPAATIQYENKKSRLHDECLSLPLNEELRRDEKTGSLGRPFVADIERPC